MLAISVAETKVLVKTAELWSKYSERISKLPKARQKIFLEDLDATIENRLRVLERAK